MRRVTASLNSGMQPLLTVTSASSSPSGQSSRGQRDSSAGSSQGTLRWRRHHQQQQEDQQRGGQGGAASLVAGLASCSDRARQRRITSLAPAAAAAQPALTLDEVGASWQQLHPTVQQQGGAAAVLASRPRPPPALPLEAAAAAGPAGLLVPAASGDAFQLPVPNLGYTCLNVELQQRFGFRSNRYCWRRTYEAGGLPLVSRLSLANCRDLLPLVEWNHAHGIHFFRIPSALFPWSHEYELEQLPDFEEIAAALARVGAAARAANQRLTAHPSHFVQLASPDPALLARSLRELELNARVFDLMGYPPSYVNKINIHIGALHGSKSRSLGLFAAALDRLSDSCRARLTVENDDRCSMFTIADLLPLHAAAGTPLVFDYLHHALVPGGLSQQEGLLAALGTWPADVRPVVHYSEPSENPAQPRRAHSRMLTQPFSLYGHEADVDVMLEAKGMERALLFYRDELQLGRKQETTAPPSRGAAGAARAASQQLPAS